MTDVENFYKNKLLENGFQQIEANESYSSIGTLFRVSPKLGEGTYWVYGFKDLYDIKIHDFLFYEDAFFNIETLDWPECLSIAFYESVSGEELMPYRRLNAGCVKSFIGGSEPYKAIYHRNIPIRTVGIEIMPAYYNKYLKAEYPNEYVAPNEAFRAIDQTNHFPEMIALLRQVWDYRGDGMAAKLFYEGKVAEAVALVIEHNRKHRPPKEVKIIKRDIELLENAASYINDHYNHEIPLETLARISCMGTTKLKSSFKQIYACTITEYIQQRRMSHAETLLSSTDFTVEQISQTVGYSNSGRFADVFRKSTGLFPSEYRKAAKR